MKNHVYILQLPKKLDKRPSAEYLNSFLEDVASQVAERKKSPIADLFGIDNTNLTFYKERVFRALQCVHTNNFLNFIFTEKDLDNAD